MGQNPDRRSACRRRNQHSDCRGRQARARRHPLQRTQTLGGGATLAGIILGAVTVFIIDRDFLKASAFAAAGAVLTFFGFIHGEAIGIASSPGVAFAYAGVAAILFACAKYAEGVPTALDPHDHVAVATPAE